MKRLILLSILNLLFASTASAAVISTKEELLEGFLKLPYELRLVLLERCHAVKGDDVEFPDDFIITEQKGFANSSDTSEVKYVSEAKLATIEKDGETLSVDDAIEHLLSQCVGTPVVSTYDARVDWDELDKLNDNLYTDGTPKELPTSLRDLARARCFMFVIKNEMAGGGESGMAAGEIQAYEKAVFERCTSMVDGKVWGGNEKCTVSGGKVINPYYCEMASHSTQDNGTVQAGERKNNMIGFALARYMKDIMDTKGDDFCAGDSSVSALTGGNGIFVSPCFLDHAAQGHKHIRTQSEFEPDPTRELNSCAEFRDQTITISQDCRSYCYQHKTCGVTVPEGSILSQDSDNIKRIPGAVFLIKKLGFSACVPGETFGLNGDGSIWVDDSCQGEFGVMYKHPSCGYRPTCPIQLSSEEDDFEVETGFSYAKITCNNAEVTAGDETTDTAPGASKLEEGAISVDLGNGAMFCKAELHVSPDVQSKTTLAEYKQAEEAYDTQISQAPTKGDDDDDVDESVVDNTKTIIEVELPFGDQMASAAQMNASISVLSGPRPELGGGTAEKQIQPHEMVDENGTSHHGIKLTSASKIELLVRVRWKAVSCVKAGERDSSNGDKCCYGLYKDYDNGTSGPGYCHVPNLIYESSLDAYSLTSVEEGVQGIYNEAKDSLALDEQLNIPLAADFDESTPKNSPVCKDQANTSQWDKARMDAGKLMLELSSYENMFTLLDGRCEGGQTDCKKVDPITQMSIDNPLPMENFDSESLELGEDSVSGVATVQLAKSYLRFKQDEASKSKENALNGDALYNELNGTENFAYVLKNNIIRNIHDATIVFRNNYYSALMRYKENLKQISCWGEEYSQWYYQKTEKRTSAVARGLHEDIPKDFEMSLFNGDHPCVTDGYSGSGKKYITLTDYFDSVSKKVKESVDPNNAKNPLINEGQENFMTEVPSIVLRYANKAYAQYSMELNMAFNFYEDSIAHAAKLSQDLMWRCAYEENCSSDNWLILAADALKGNTAPADLVDAQDDGNDSNNLEAAPRQASSYRSNNRVIDDLWHDPIYNTKAFDDVGDIFYNLASMDGKTTKKTVKRDGYNSFMDNAVAGYSPYMTYMDYLQGKMVTIGEDNNQSAGLPNVSEKFSETVKGFTQEKQKEWYKLVFQLYASEFPLRTSSPIFETLQEMGAGDSEVEFFKKISDHASGAVNKDGKSIFNKSSAKSLLGQSDDSEETLAGLPKLCTVSNKWAKDITGANQDEVGDQVRTPIGKVLIPMRMYQVIKAMRKYTEQTALVSLGQAAVCLTNDYKETNTIDTKDLRKAKDGLGKASTTFQKAIDIDGGAKTIDQASKQGGGTPTQTISTAAFDGTTSGIAGITSNASMDAQGTNFNSGSNSGTSMYVNGNILAEAFRKNQMAINAKKAKARSRYEKVLNAAKRRKAARKNLDGYRDSLKDTLGKQLDGKNGMFAAVNRALTAGGANAVTKGTNGQNSNSGSVTGSGKGYNATSGRGSQYTGGKGLGKSKKRRGRSGSRSKVTNVAGTSYSGGKGAKGSGSGLSDSETRRILKAAKSSRYNKSDDDSLFEQISKRYIRSAYPTLLKKDIE
jgi:hypothetical protein